MQNTVKTLYYQRQINPNPSAVRLMMVSINHIYARTPVVKDTAIEDAALEDVCDYGHL